MAELKVCGLGQRTVNHYLAAMKQFTKWLVADRRTSENRLTYLKGGNASLDVRRERRELNDAEIGGLLEAARNGKVVCGLTGLQRFTLYSTALGTGLRASELASLTVAHFDLSAEPPTVAIHAADEKSRRGDVLPLPSDLVRMLSRFLAHMPSEERLWPGTWAKSHNGSKLMQHDLQVADVPYKTDEGQADFHALRHTYLSRLGRSGASPKAMQRLARHTTVELTLGKYTHANLYDLASAVDGLPPLPTGSTNDETARELQATGTDAADSLPASVLPSGLPEKGAQQRPFVQLSAASNQPDLTKSGRVSDSKKAEKTRTKQVFPAKNGSGWESNPPGSFSEATLGLKPRTVTRSAYTPRRCEVNCAIGSNCCQSHPSGIGSTAHTNKRFAAGESNRCPQLSWRPLRGHRQIGDSLDHEFDDIVGHVRRFNLVGFPIHTKSLQKLRWQCAMIHSTAPTATRFN